MRSSFSGQFHSRREHLASSLNLYPQGDHSERGFTCSTNIYWVHIPMKLCSTSSNLSVSHPSQHAHEADIMFTLTLQLRPPEAQRGEVLGLGPPQ